MVDRRGWQPLHTYDRYMYRRQTPMSVLDRTRSSILRQGSALFLNNIVSCRRSEGRVNESLRYLSLPLYPCTTTQVGSLLSQSAKCSVPGCQGAKTARLQHRYLPRTNCTYVLYPARPTPNTSNWKNCHRTMSSNY